MFAPVEDRDEPGQGFTHKEGDIVTIPSPKLGALVNRVGRSDQIAAVGVRRAGADAQPRRPGAAVTPPDYRHPRESGDPGQATERSLRIPAFAGMTLRGNCRRGRRR